MTRTSMYAAIFSIWAGVALAQDAPKAPPSEAHGHDTTPAMQMSKAAVRSTTLTITFGDKTAT